jgi:PAS domain S-box-containing protein
MEIEWKVFGPIAAALVVVIALVIIRNRRLSRAMRERNRVQGELQAQAKALESRSSVRSQISKISSDLQKTMTFEELAQIFMAQAIPLLGVHYGILYVLNKDSGLLGPVGGYGAADGDSQRVFATGQGLVGQCALEKKSITITDTTDSGIFINWGMGEVAPKEILLQPLVQKEQTVGVLELASVGAFPEYSRQMLGELVLTLAMNIEILDRNLRTRSLLEATHEQAVKLQQQQEELTESSLMREEANRALQKQVGELAHARLAMMNIMEDLEMAKKETDARNVETQELLQQTQRQAEELKIQQEQIKEAEERSRTILNAISVGTMIIHPQTKIISDVNPVAAGIIGLAREDIIGRTCHKFVCPKEERQCPITDLGQTVDNSERVILNAGGKEIPVIKTVTSVMLGGEEFLLESFVDITERKEIEKKLLESSEQIRVLSNVVEQSPLSVMITDREGRIEYVNPKFANLTGYDATEIRGNNPRFLKSGKHDLHFYADLWETILSGKEWHGQICNRRKNGELYWERASISSIHSQLGDITHFVSIREDFTEQMRMEAELKERMGELERFNQLTIKREEKMISLKEEINALLLQTGREAKYKIVA